MASLEFIEVYVEDFETLNFRERNVDEEFLLDYSDFEDTIQDSTDGGFLVDSTGDEIS